MPGKLIVMLGFLYENGPESMKKMTDFRNDALTSVMCTFRNEMAERERLPTGTKHSNAVSHRTILPASCEALWFFQRDACWYCGRVWSGLAAQMREAVELPLLPPPLVTLTETSLCKGLSTLPALDIFREAILILQYFSSSSAFIVLFQMLYIQSEAQCVIILHVYIYQSL